MPPLTIVGEVRDVPSTTLKRNITGVGIKLGTYDSTTCLETFLVSVKNFVSYLQWTKEDELFCLRTSICGPAGQLLWDIGPQFMLAHRIWFLRKRFGTTDKAERFCSELQSRRQKEGETLQRLYNDFCHLMSLAYPGPTTDLCNVVSRDAFLGLCRTHL